MATYSSTLAWKIPWMEEPGRLQSMGSLRIGHEWATSLSLSGIGEGNGNPLQCSCLENPREGEAWWATVYGVTQSWTQLKWLSSSSNSSTILSWWQQLCSIIWCQEGWFLPPNSSFSRLLWLFGVFCVSLWIVKFFVLVLWKNAIGNLIGITLNL